MPTFEILKKSEIKQSFHDKIIIDSYSILSEHLENTFRGEIPIENLEWNIGLIVGNSGTGKTIITKQLWPDKLKIKKYKKGKSLIGSFPEKMDIKNITACLSKMGLNSPPLWLQEYDTLSTGEKMRADLALNLIEKDFFVFDEFTSVVDRTVAKITSTVVEKYVRHNNKQFIAISCHQDIIPWLRPDWIFDTAKMEYLHSPRGCLWQRPKIKVEIREEKGYWHCFRRYHYLNGNLHHGARQFVGFTNNMPIVFCGVIHFPMKYKQKNKHIWRVTRLVCLPEYQGIGAGMKLLDFVGNIFLKENKRFTITTSNYSLILGFQKIKTWKQTYSGHHPKHTLGRNKITKALQNTCSTGRRTWSYEKIK